MTSFSSPNNPVRQNSVLSNALHKGIALIILMALTVGISSCKKSEGKGGKLTIKGKVYALFYDDDLNYKTSEGYLQDHSVYIIYGDQSGYGDKATTGVDGSFEFNFLRKGKYTIYTYSEDTTKISSSGEVPVSIEVTIEKDRTLDDLIVVDQDKKEFSIRGYVGVQDYDVGFYYYKPDTDVYISRGTSSYYFDRVRTHGVDGGPGSGQYPFYEFNVPNGTYMVSAYSKSFLDGRDTLITRTVIVNGANIVADTIKTVDF